MDGNLRKYSLKDWIDLWNKRHKEEYKYHKVLDIISGKTPVEIYDPKLDMYFWQTPAAHSLYGNPHRNGGISYTKERFIELANKKHDNEYAYHRVDYKKSSIHVEIYDPKHDMYFWQTPAEHLSGSGNPARKTSISKISLTWLLSIDPEQKFVVPYQEPTIINNRKKRKVDGYDPTTNTVYQFHGNYWHGLSKDGKEVIDQVRYSDTLKKDQEIRDSGYNLVIMWEHNWNPTEEDWNRIPKYKTLTEKFIEQAIEIHGDTYRYHLVEYKTARTKVCVVDPVYGEFWITPYSHLRGQGCYKRNTKQTCQYCGKTTIKMNIIRWHKKCKPV